jgi:hypothetical protein
MANISLQLHERLDAVQKHFDLFDHAPSPSLEPRPGNTAQIDPLQFESTILDGMPVRTRAGLFVYFNAAVSSVQLRKAYPADLAALWQTAGRRPQNNFISERTLCCGSRFSLLKH